MAWWRGVVVGGIALTGCTGRVAVPTDAARVDTVLDTPEPHARDVPTLAIGYDAFRRWDHWATLRLGERVVMRSTYDRAGGNDRADANHFLRQDDETHSVTLDVTGPGVLTFVRTNHWHGSPWHYVVDGTDTTVTESSTGDPTHPVPNSTFLPAATFAPPVAVTWSTTRGADLSWVPVPFAQQFQMAYGRTFYGTGYYIVQQFPDGPDNLSQPLSAWDPSTAVPPDVMDLLTHAGQDIAPAGTPVQGTLALPTTGAVDVATLTQSPSTVRALRFVVAPADAAAFAQARLQITWDGRGAPSVDAPVALFFGTGSMFARDGRAGLVQALPVNVNVGPDGVTFATYFPMPFQRSAHIALVSSGVPVASVQWQIRTEPYTDPANWAGYLHATYRDHGTPTPGHDLVLLDTMQTEGGGDWCGHLVGTSFVFSDRAALGTLEGDPRFFFDDSQTPQAQGTGTEEWGGGGDYWGGQTMTLPLVGHPVGAPSPDMALNSDDAIESAYRFLLADAMPFGRNARIQLEHGGEDQSTEHYRTVTYWYGLAGACLVPTDTFHVSDPVDEAAHAYVSPDASGIDSVTSRYEWGVDHVGATEVYPATTDTGRHTTGTSTFTLRIDPDNVGVLLRRTLDYAFPDQRAEVYIGDAASNRPLVHAGTWYLAGSNQSVVSAPATETGASQHEITASNRRWRDDEFQVPRRLTEGRSALRVQVANTSLAHSLVPGAAALPTAWSEYRYRAYVVRLPPMP